MGSYVPAQRIGNDYFTAINGKSSEWMEQRTGIRTRSKAAENENHNTMGIEAVRDALKNLQYPVQDVDLIVSAAYSPLDLVATLAHEAQREFEIDGAKALYCSSACSSFINGLEIVEGYFAMGKATKALIISSEHNTYYSNEQDTKSGHLWGDAAVAWFISQERQSPTDWKIDTIFTQGLGNIGKGPDGVKLRPREYGISMPDGRDVFIHACRYMIYSLDKALGQLGINRSDIGHFICHQANKRIVAQVAHQLDLPMESFYNNIEELGNTGSASAALVLTQNADNIKPEEKVALMVFGGGYSCGCFIVTKP